MGLRKVYCEECRYFVEPNICKYPDNCVKNWKSRNYKYYKKPASINKNNNCSWYGS